MIRCRNLTTCVSFRHEFESLTDQRDRKEIVDAYAIVAFYGGLTLAALAWIWLLRAPSSTTLDGAFSA